MTPEAGEKAVHSQIRGSGLLTLGRIVAKWQNLIIQVLLVRILSQADYGALAYALSIVVLAGQVATFGLHQSVSRFVPIYQEERQYDKLFGTLLLALGIVVAMGFLLVATVYAGKGFLEGSVIRDPRVLALLLWLIFLVPIQATDSLLLGMFAVFASPGSIFFRRHVLSPGLKLVVLLLVMLGNRDVFLVAGGYLAAEFLGLAVGAVLLGHFLQRQKLFEHFHWRTLQTPWRAVLGFTVPLFSSEFLFVILPAMDVILLERLGNVEAVATFRAVYPLAMVNQLVITSFVPLYMPAAARMLARHDRHGIGNLYRQTTLWIAVLACPLFLVTFALAEPMTVLLFGARYRESTGILSLLALAWYFDAATGFNALTLKVYSRFRVVMLINAATLAINLVGLLALLPRYGALGAGIATCVAVIAHNVFNQIGLSSTTGIRLVDPRIVSVYAMIGLGALAVWLVERLAAPPVYVGLALAAAAALAVLRASGRQLQTTQVFPELARIPLMKQILGW